MPELGGCLTPKPYVDNAISNSIDESPLLRLDSNEKLNLDEQDSIILNSTLTSPKTRVEIPTKNYADYKFDHPSIMKNAAPVDFLDKILHNVRFVKVNCMPAVGEHLTAKYCFDNAIFYSVEGSSLLGLDPDEK